MAGEGTRRSSRERPLHLDMEEANRRDAQAAGELAHQPDSHRGQPWWTPSGDDGWEQ